MMPEFAVFPPNIVWVKEVIISTKALIGNGQEGNPVRNILEIFTLEGELIAVHDPWKDEDGKP